MLTSTAHDGHTYLLHGDPMSQADLVERLNARFGTHLIYRSMSVQAYREDRVGALGEFMGSVIAGIYEGIRSGAHDQPSDYAAAAGRPHQGWDDYFRN